MSKCARNQKLEIFEPDRLKIPKFPVPQDYRDSVATFADFNNHQKIPDNDQNTFAFTDFKSCIDRPVINQHRFKIFTYQYCEKCEFKTSNKSTLNAHMSAIPPGGKRRHALCRRGAPKHG